MKDQVVQAAGGRCSTWGAPLDLSTTIESTTTSLHAVLRDPTRVAMTAPVGDVTAVAIASQDVVPAAAN